MGGSRPAHVRRLIDGLIERAHSEWPAVTFVLAFPSGERVLLPRHLAGLAPCDDRHSGYFAMVILPHCAADPIPRVRGTCRMVPLRGTGRIPPEYRLELASGEVVTVAAPGETDPGTTPGRRAAVHDAGPQTREPPDAGGIGRFR